MSIKRPRLLILCTGRASAQCPPLRARVKEDGQKMENPVPRAKVIQVHPRLGGAVWQSVRTRHV